MSKPDHLMPKFPGQLDRCKPHSMSRMDVDKEHSVFLQEQALSIFTECSNSGLPLRETLSAILISGIDWGMHAKQPINH